MGWSLNCYAPFIINDFPHIVYPIMMSYPTCQYPIYHIPQLQKLQSQPYVISHVILHMSYLIHHTHMTYTCHTTNVILMSYPYVIPTCHTPYVIPTCHTPYVIPHIPYPTCHNPQVIPHVSYPMSYSMCHILMSHLIYDIPYVIPHICYIPYIQGCRVSVAL